MTEGRGVFGNIFENGTILWFIILFLLLFWNYSGNTYDYKVAVEPNLTIE